MKIYCLHHKPAKERKEKLLKDFEHHGLKVEWIETFLPEDIDRSKLDIRHKLNDGALSLYLKHQFCLQEQIKNNCNEILIFEDDVLLPHNLDIKNYIQKAYNEFISQQGDMLQLGTAFGMKPAIISPNKMVYHEPHFNTRCTHAILHTLSTTKKIIKLLDVIDDAIDWKFNHIIKSEKLKSCYVEPGLEQNSLNGGEKSLVQY